MSTVIGLDRKASMEWYARNRLRSGELFDCARPEAYYDRPISLRNPICFYEGHLPAFSVNTLIKRGLKEPGVDAEYEILFERGIDPEDESTAGGGATRWPSREKTLAYGREADRRVAQALDEKDIEREEDPVLRGGLAAYTILEHEPMHQETLRYMWHRLPYEKKVRPVGAESGPADGSHPPPETVRIPRGTATLGTTLERVRFGWDNEFSEHRVEVPSFQIDVNNVTNRDFLEFVEDGGYQKPELWEESAWQWRIHEAVEHPLFWEREDGRWFWRGMFERFPLPEAWPVYVSQSEASAYARWKGKRLPTEAEFHRAAYGSPAGAERSYPWGEEPPDETRGNFDFRRWDPLPVGSFPSGASAWGVQDLVGNGWEWTSTVFQGFAGFVPMPSYPNYSADFFDGKHYVLKGASPATARELLRRSFRNWFRSNYPYVYATFRCVE
jgi:gamma-glutamyl hercynylcysteine S-oxide synthase